MPELGTAWVSLTISTQNMERDIRKAFQRVEKAAKISPEIDASKTASKAQSSGSRFGQLFSRSAKAAPDVDTSKMTRKATSAGQEFGSRFSAGAKAGLAALGAAGLASTVIDQFKQVMSTGMDYEKSMNTLKVVSEATDEQMKAAGETARQLGTDITLPGTSANDAAAAMTELAKAGLNVTEAMQATKGALALAAAGDLGAAQAAEIQGDALNTFQLGAEKADMVADLLANAANASSGSVSEMAAGLAQAGSVAAGFGVNIEDTITSLAMFAKFGIKGSDAGTMMKTSLQALTDPGKPAQAAIDQLGMSVYDAQGKMRDYPEILMQIADAQKKMNLTDEQFQSATNTLFGSDAMRASMVAANGGAEAFDKLYDKVTKVGGAIDTAAGKNVGLVGAWESVKNSAESLRLSAYDGLKGHAEGLLRSLSDGMNNLGKAGESSTFGSIIDAVKTAAPGLEAIAVSLGKAAAAVGLGVWKAFAAVLSAAAAALKLAAPLLKSIGDFMSNNQGLVTGFVAAFAGLKFLPSVLGRVSDAFLPLTNGLKGVGDKARNMKSGVSNAANSFKTLVGYVQQSNPQLSNAEARMSALKQTAGQTASAGLGAMKTAAGGLVTALGGPLNIALMAGAAAFGYVASKSAEASAAADAWKTATAQESDDARNLTTALMGTAGAFDAVATAAARKQIADGIDKLNQPEGGKVPSILDGFRAENGSLWDGLTDWSRTTKEEAMNGQAKLRADAAGLIKSLVPDEGALTDQIKGDPAQFNALVTALQNQGEAGQIAATKVQELRTSILGAQAAATTAAPVLARLGDGSVQSAEQLASSGAKVKVALESLPKDVPIRIDTPNGANAFELLSNLGAKVSEIPGTKEIAIDAPASQQVIDALAAIGVLVRSDNGKLIIVEQQGAEQAGAEIDAEANKSRTAVISVVTKYGADIGTNPAKQEQFKNDFRTAWGAKPRADGAIVPMANGGMRMIEKPDQADIYDGRGAGTVFAEEETGGEAYIPLAPAKRERSTAILAEVARLFGLTVGQQGGGPSGADLVGGMGSSVTSPIVDALGNISDSVSSDSPDSGASAAVLRAQSVVVGAQARLDAATAALQKLAEQGKDTGVAEQRRQAAELSLEAANKRLDEVKSKDGGSGGKADGNDGASLGQSIVGGMLESIGLDGSVFSNPFEWANVKSGMALANWGGGLLKGALGGGERQDGSMASDVAGGALGGIGLPNLGDFLKPLQGGPIEPARQPDAPHQGGGQQPGPAVVVNGNVGMDPRQFTQRVDSAQNQSYRQHITAVRPRA